MWGCNVQGKYCSNLPSTEHKMCVCVCTSNFVLMYKDVWLYICMFLFEYDWVNYVFVCLCVCEFFGGRWGLCISKLKSLPNRLSLK